MEKELRADWFVRESIGDTLKNLLEAADLPYLAQVSPAEFARLLMNEVHFLGAYSRQEERDVERYIEQHLTELYRFMQTLAQRQHAL
ncbi:MAG TPA: hypothetical protein VGX03_23540 [Candidatus Binatia bacterium]|jgi:hypothetical protein|nr:hypothetical protein [Candidatus Binatia bacterium]